MLHRAVSLRIPGDGRIGIAVRVVGAVVGVALLILRDQGLILRLNVLVGHRDVLDDVVLHRSADRVILLRLGIGLAAEAVVRPVLLRLRAHLVGDLLGVGIVVAQIVVDVALHGGVGGSLELGQGGLVELIQTQLHSLGLDHRVLNRAVHQILLHGPLHAVGDKVDAVGSVLGAHGIVSLLHVLEPDHAVLAKGGDDLRGIVGIVGIHQRLQLRDLRRCIAVARRRFGSGFRLSRKRLGLGCLHRSLQIGDGRIGLVQLRLKLGDADVGGVQLRLNILAAASSHGQYQRQHHADAQNSLQSHVSDPSILCAFAQDSESDYSTALCESQRRRRPIWRKRPIV